MVVKFVWLNDDMEIQHTRAFEVGRTTRGLKWNGRRPDTYLFDGDEDDIPAWITYMWRITLAG